MQASMKKAPSRSLGAVLKSLPQLRLKAERCGVSGGGMRSAAQSASFEINNEKVANCKATKARSKRGPKLR